MGTDERCVVDPGRPCGGCSAPGPSLCPYRYLLDDDELAALKSRKQTPAQRDQLASASAARA